MDQGQSFGVPAGKAQPTMGECAILVVMNTTHTSRVGHSAFTRMGRLASVAGAIGLSLMLGGCSKALAPSFKAVGVRVIEEQDAGSVIEFSIEATNPNKEPIPMRQISYGVELDGVEVFTGVRSPEMTLHTYSTQMFRLPAVLPAGALEGKGVVSYTLNGSALYIPPGRLAEVLFDMKVKMPEARLDLSGTIDTGN